jgi:beta-phosphoglucomutase
MRAVLRAILFDFNGVLVDDEPIHLRLLQQVLAEEGVILQAEEYYRQFLGLDDRTCFAALIGRAGREAGPQHLMRLVARKASYYQEVIRKQGYPFVAGALDLVEAAAQARLMLGVVSGALREEVEEALRQGGVRGRFKVVVAAEDVDLGKPDAEGYRRALEALNSEPPLPERLLHAHEVLAIEDSPAGLTAAAAAGLVTLGVAHTMPQGRLGPADAFAAHLSTLSVPQLAEIFSQASAR